MRDVSHTPPTGESVTNVWQRGRASEPGERTDAVDTSDSAAGADATDGDD